ncbi:MAG: LysR family transcriptional regulator [Tropicimonas sp.]|uniref:LysR substrate-binding domain-containing protein n=1 Tax=Tropicimonas sp. TaxID=2067044 RepID=UPI003A88D304
MKNDFLRSVERFVAVADEGSIQAASRVLNISQPSLTLSVARIEEGFGTRLFERSKRGVTLTPAGALLYPRAKEILSQGAMAQREIDDVIGRRTGQFHIRAGSSWGYCFMPSIVAGLKKEFPALNITFNIGNTDQAFPQLLSGEVDVIVGRIAGDLPAMPGIVVTDLTEIRYVMICGASHPLAGLDRPVQPADLAAHSFVAYEPDVKTLQETFAPLSEEGRWPVRIALKTRSPHAALEMVETGDFLCCLSGPFVHRYKTRDMRILEVGVPLLRSRSGIFNRETLTPTDPFRSLMARLKAAARSIEQMGYGDGPEG